MIQIILTMTHYLFFIGIEFNCNINYVFNYNRKIKINNFINYYACTSISFYGSVSFKRVHFLVKYKGLLDDDKIKFVMGIPSST